METEKSFFDNFPPKTAFIAGFVSAILVMGTIGFIVLASCTLRGTCAFAGAAAPLAIAPTPSAAAPSNGQPQAGPIPTVTAADHIRGDKNAPITIVEYSDFECPFCARFHPTMQQVMTDYAGKVRWVYRSFPLSIHPNAQPAAIAGECAAAQGKFWEFADAMFTGQDANLSGDGATAEAYYLATAKKLGLNMSKFDACRKDPKTLATVQASEQGGVTAGVNGTPGSFVIDAKGNVQPILGALPYESVKPMIDAALSAS